MNNPGYGQPPEMGINYRPPTEDAQAVSADRAEAFGKQEVATNLNPVSEDVK